MIFMLNVKKFGFHFVVLEGAILVLRKLPVLLSSGVRYVREYEVNFVLYFVWVGVKFDI